MGPSTPCEGAQVLQFTEALSTVSGHGSRQNRLERMHAENRSFKTRMSTASAVPRLGSSQGSLWGCGLIWAVCGAWVDLVTGGVCTCVLRVACLVLRRP